MNTNYLVLSVLGLLLTSGMPGSIHLGGPSLPPANASMIALQDGGTLLNTPLAREPVLGNGLAGICTVSGDSGKPILVNNYTPLVKTPTLVMMQGGSSSMWFDNNNLSGASV